MIRINNLRKFYGDVEILRDITLDIPQGQFVCLLGLSGAGKTTLLRCLNGLATGAKGDVTIAGLKLHEQGDLGVLRKQIGIIFQHFNLVSRLTALDNVLTGLSASVPTARSFLGRYTKEEIDFANQCLARVGLLHKANQRADTLSGGEKQRVAIARALAQKPRVILADEPVSSVDPKVGHQLLALLQTIAREDKITVLCNLHNLELAREFADRIVGMAHGRIVFDGRPQELNAAAVESIYPSPATAKPIDSESSVVKLRPEKADSLAKTKAAESHFSLKRYYWGTAIIAVLIWSAMGAELSPYSLAVGVPQMADFFVRMFPPNFERLPEWIKPLLETIQIAIWGTLLAVIAGVPLGLLAARNITPAKPVYWAARGLLNLFRGVSELVFALIFVAAVGLGPFPGVLALAVHNLGMLGKFYADSIENVDPGPIEALYSTGASKLHMIRWAIFPQIVPDFISFNLYRFEVSVRAATVLGLVGAGGIGFPLITSLRLFRYDETTTILILIVSMVIITDAIAGWLRRKVI